MSTNSRRVIVKNSAFSSFLFRRHSFSSPTVKMIFYGLLAILCIHSVHCQKTTNVSVSLGRKANDIIGGIAKMTCTVLYPINVNTSWVRVTKDNITESVVLTSGNKVIVNDSRFSLRQEFVATDQFEAYCYSLLIMGLKKTDAGMYRCQVMLQSNNTIFAETELKVFGLVPARIFNNITKSLVVMKGSPLKLGCYASGSPEPTVFWKRENDAIFSTKGGSFYGDNILEIPVTKKEDSGIYYCLATNGVEPTTIERHAVVVIIEFPPVVTTSKHFRGQALKYYMDLDCHTEAYPVSTVVWMRNGLQLSNNQYYKISNVSTPSQDTIDSNLRITINDKHLYGDYICKASNILGTAEVKINLYETTKKTCPPACY